MDFQVEATVHLQSFANKFEVRQILRSNDFELEDMGRDQVRVKGSFLKLKAAKASLEQIHYLQSKTVVAPSSTSPDLKVSSGAISKNYSNTDGTTGRSRSPKKPLHASPASPTTASPLAPRSNRPISPEPRDSFSPRPDLGGSFRQGKESFLVDADVFLYANQLRRKDIDCILESHNVIIQSAEVIEDTCSISLMGRSARVAAGKLQSFLNELSKSLRTQEVPLRDVGPEGRALLESIQRHPNVCDSVLVREKSDRLHLVGSSGESYNLKQRLLGKSSERSGRTGRTMDKNSRGRSSSLPPISRRNTEREKGANARQPPMGAAAYSPSKYQDDKRVEHERPAAPTGGRISGRRSQSESRKKNKAEKTSEAVQERENNRTPAKSPKTILHIMSVGDIKQKLKGWTSRKGK